MECVEFGDCRLYSGDCLDVLKKIPDGSVDVVVTSPPYNMNLRIRDGKYMSRLPKGSDQPRDSRSSDISSKYAGFDDCLSMDDYFEFNKSIVIELLRVSALVFYNVQFLTGNKVALFRLIGEFSNKLKEIIVWDKCMAEPAIQKGVLNSRFEVLLVFQNSAPESRLFECAEFNRGELENLWAIRRDRSATNEHGATFPLELVQCVIDNFTAAGATVPDPFMGTGTTGIACIGKKRKFIGIEINDRYFSLAADRMRAAQQARMVSIDRLRDIWGITDVQ